MRPTAVLLKGLKTLEEYNGRLLGSHTPRNALVTMGTGSLPGVKRPGRGADHPPHLSAEVMKG